VSNASKRERQRLNREARLEYEKTLAQRRRMFRTARVFVPVTMIAVVAVVLLSGGGDDSTAKSASGAVEYATISTSLGDIVVALEDKEAPQSENHFAGLVEQGFYDGSTFHRAAKDFAIQGGTKNGDGMTNSGNAVPDEFPKTPYKLGDFVLANTGAPNSSDSQFFILTGSKGITLPLKYNRIGHVVRGLDIAQQIEALSPTTGADAGDGAPTHVVSIGTITLSKKPPPAAPNLPLTTRVQTTPST
jgi:cyclophilin family peptidyl-prolyl cis-trans isomerase